MIIKCSNHGCKEEAMARHQIFYTAPLNTWGQKYYLCEQCIDKWKSKNRKLSENVDYLTYTKKEWAFWDD